MSCCHCVGGDKYPGKIIKLDRLGRCYYCKEDLTQMVDTGNKMVMPDEQTFKTSVLRDIQTKGLEAVVVEIAWQLASLTHTTVKFSEVVREMSSLLHTHAPYGETAQLDKKQTIDFQGQTKVPE